MHNWKNKIKVRLPTLWRPIYCLQHRDPLVVLLLNWLMAGGLVVKRAISLALTCWSFCRVWHVFEEFFFTNYILINTIFTIFGKQKASTNCYFAALLSRYMFITSCFAWTVIKLLHMITSIINHSIIFYFTFFSNVKKHLL